MDQLEEFVFAEEERDFLNAKTLATDAAQENWKILIVDDERDVHDVTILVLKRLLFDSRGLVFLSAFSATEAKVILHAHPDISVILLDVVMEDDHAGLSLVRYIREEMNNGMVRIILRTGHPGQAPEESVVMEYDINDYRGKTELTALSLRTVLITALRSYRALAIIQELNREIKETQEELIYALGEIAESRSVETGHHVRRVGETSRILATKCGLPVEQTFLLQLAASMHDLGKMAINDSILNKPGPLSVAEFEIMKTHCVLGSKILGGSKRQLLQLAATIAKEHHENYDGTGYPQGLKAEEINIYSRIVALADVFDALGMKRVYKESWPREKILECIRAERGKKFDPHLVDLFFQNVEEIERVGKMFSNPEK